MHPMANGIHIYIYICLDVSECNNNLYKKSEDLHKKYISHSPVNHTAGISGKET